MCFSYEASVSGAASAVFFGVAAFKFIRWRYGPDAHLLSVLTLLISLAVALMQVAEATIWYTMGDDDACLWPARFGYMANVLQPYIITIIPGMVYFYMKKDWYRMKLLFGLGVFYAAGLLLPQSNLPQVCAVLTPNGHLNQPYWPRKEIFYFITVTLGSLLLPWATAIPLLGAFYATAGLALIFYAREAQGSASFLFWAAREAVGSTWCYAAILIPFFTIVQYEYYHRYLR
jgi:hypothetical protein